jgi:alpha-glucosidase
LRRSRPALARGSYRALRWDKSSEDLLLFMREHANDRALVALNFGAKPVRASLGAEAFTGRLLLSSHLDREDEEFRGALSLRPNEGQVIGLQ